MDTLPVEIIAHTISFFINYDLLKKFMSETWFLKLKNNTLLKDTIHEFKLKNYILVKKEFSLMYHGINIKGFEHLNFDYLQCMIMKGYIQYIVNGYNEFVKSYEIDIFQMNESYPDFYEDHIIHTAHMENKDTEGSLKSKDKYFSDSYKTKFSINDLIYCKIIDDYLPSQIDYLQLLNHYDSEYNMRYLKVTRTNL